ncbi:hypothetical protein E4T49_00473 [Aureobasidium sp. EXF-10728]|nr:hypothetical protein E4T49_00473 [Aureobasidium sp. EXF-10728]
MIRQTLLLISGLALASAADPMSGSTFGDTNNTALMAARHDPNITSAVGFQMGNQNFTFRVDVAELTPDWNTTVQNPRVVTSFYTLVWQSGTSLNDTITAAEALGDGQSARVCAALPLGLLSASTNNGYSNNDNGDCTGALGKQCVQDLKQASYAPNVPCSPTIPQSCASKFGSGGIGSAPLGAQGETQMSPLDFFHWSSPAYTAGNDTAYTRETERLHVVIFSGKDTYPVCLRVKTDHVNKKSPATSGAAKGSSASLMSLVMLVISVAMWLT